MFCDLVGYTDLAERFDPEEIREVLLPYQEACADAITRFDGHVAQYLGDGVLAYFGFPRAHEDDPERAVRAALALQTALGELNERLLSRGAPGIDARIGIHTGLVVISAVGSEGHRETLAIGDAINTAARLQAIAEPGGILISEVTWRLVAGLFVTRDCGDQELKGISDPVRAHEVLGTARLGRRSATSSRPTPLTGRDGVLTDFEARWDRAARGEGHAMLIEGEPGIGKSRVLQAFHETLGSVPHLTVEIHCSAHATNNAFQPVIDLYAEALGFTADDPPADRLASLESNLLRIADLDAPEVVPYVGSLLGLPPSERFPLTQMAPDRQREKTLEALIAPILAIARTQPVLVACEDLHWSDPSTLQMLGALIERLPGQRILLALTYRPSFVPPWLLPEASGSPLVLGPLSDADSRALVAAAAGGAGKLTGEVLDGIAARADGIPLFAEELVRSMLDAEAAQQGSPDTSATDALHIPMTLQDSLMARLDRLEETKTLAQLGSVLGREFPLALIEALSEFEPDALRAALDELVDAEILLEQRGAGQIVYVFKHALIQDTAYESQLRRRRRELHGRVAAILEDRFPERAAAEPEELARHHAAGGHPSQAVGCYQQAAEKAVGRLSNEEAIEYYRRALELLRTQPENDARNQKEIELSLALAGPMAAASGHDAPETVATCARIETLYEALEPGPVRLPAVLGLMLYNVNRGHLPRAAEYAASLLELAEPLGVAGLLVAGHMIQGTAAMTAATGSEALHHLERAIEIAQGAELPPPTKPFDADPLTIAYSVYSIALLVAGRPDTSADIGQRAIERARQLGHPRTLGSALVNVSMGVTFREDAARTLALTDECLDVVDGRGFHSVECSARVQAGWAQTYLGDPDGARGVEAGLDLARQSGALGGLSQLYFIAADTYRLLGRYDDAFEALAQGRSIIEETGEYVGLGPQVPTTHARILLASGAAPVNEVEQLLHEAFEGWTRAQTPWLQLECALLLGRQALKSGDIASARRRLQETFDLFEEGHATDRMRSARVLLDELSAAAQ